MRSTNPSSMAACVISRDLIADFAREIRSRGTIRNPQPRTIRVFIKLR